MSIDRADWHWDSAMKAYRERNDIMGDLTEEQLNEIWLYAADHIGVFLRWIIENGYEGEESDPMGCERVRNGEITGAEYLMEYCDGKFWDCDICEELKPFVAEYYESDDDEREYRYFHDYFNAVNGKVYEIISGDKEYSAAAELINKAYNALKK